MKWWDWCYDLKFFKCCFKPTFSLSSFTFIKRLFSSSLLSVISMVLSAYLMLLVFLSTILIPAWASSSPAFQMMYSAYKLNKQGDNIQPWCTPFLIWNQSFVPHLVLTVVSWPAYRFLRRQVRWSGIPISHSLCSLWKFWDFLSLHLCCLFLTLGMPAPHVPCTEHSRIIYLKCDFYFEAFS